jgi:phosphatidate cytidylyltransferase
MAVAVGAFVVFRFALAAERVVAARPFLSLPLIGLAVSGLAIAFSYAADKGVNEVLFSGQDALPGLVSGAAGWSLSALALLIGFKALAWGLSLSGFRGGPTFPAMFIGAAARRDRDGVSTSLAFTTLGILWIAIPFAHAVLLRELPAHGGALLIDVLVGTFFTDTCAYFGGRLFGRTPLAPRLSPQKTVEGLVIGVIGGTMAFWFAGLYQDWLSGIDALVIGFCVAIAAPVGDLFESMVKRDLGVKDTGRIFGPHGGLLDRLDAVMFTIVVGYYLARAFVY